MPDDAKNANLSATRQLCEYLARARFKDLPEEAIHEARRGVLDWLGCALAGSTQPTIDTLLTVLGEIAGKPAATVFGRRTKLGLLDAALANGQMGHILDFDDTHMGGVVLHTSSPVLAALFALAERNTASGKDLILAYAAGFEAGVRTGQTAPRHHDGGWHLTGTLGSTAAGVAAGKLLGLDGLGLTHAMGIATTQGAGMQQNRGTMCKSFHAGKAAASGVLAGLLAEQGFDSSQEIVEGKRGFCRIYSTVAVPEKLLANLGARWEITRNGYKPYACGVVLHPPIDAMITLGTQHPLDPAAIEAIELAVHPHVVSITGVVEPQTGLQSKFSIYHSAAVAFIDRAAGRAQYTDARALDPQVVTLRRKVKVVTDDTLRKDEAHARISAGGKTYDAYVAHATGTVDNPMTDPAIEAKFLANAAGVVTTESARRAADMVWDLERVADLRELTALLA